MISASLYYILLPLRIKIPPCFSRSSTERNHLFIELLQENWPFPFFLSTIIRRLNVLAQLHKEKKLIMITSGERPCETAEQE